jgi:hypothetical protein
MENTSSVVVDVTAFTARSDTGKCVPSLRNGLSNPVAPPVLGADYIENTASSIVECWTVFTELLPGNA